MTPAPEGRRCPECGKATEADLVPGIRRCMNEDCPTWLQPVSPTPAPVGGEARCKCGDPACTLWREDEVCPHCSARFAALNADPEYEGHGGDGGEGHYADCAHGERSAPTLAATGGEEESFDALIAEAARRIQHAQLTPHGANGVVLLLVKASMAHDTLRRQLAEAEKVAAEERQKYEAAIQVAGNNVRKTREATERATTAERRLEEATVSLAHLRTDVSIYRRRATGAEQEVARLRRAGAMLANCAYNLAQHDHLTADERRSLDESRKAWDAALSAPNQSTGQGA